MICRWLKNTTYFNVEQPSPQNIIGVGQFAIVHKLNDKIVRKVPSDKSYTYSVQAFEIEAKVYSHLGSHKRIARCVRCGDDYIDLRYEPNGDLETYLKENPLSDRLKYRLARQAIDAVIFIHEKRVIHSDLSAQQFLVDKHCNIRLSGFGGSSLNGSDAIVIENATHFLPRDEESPNTIQSDMFALGSTIYEILVGQKPYSGMEEEYVQRLYSNKEFPGLDGIGDIQWRNVIQKCWRTDYKSTLDILEDIPTFPLALRVFTKIQLTFHGLR